MNDSRTVNKDSVLSRLFKRVHTYRSYKELSGCMIDLIGSAQKRRRHGGHRHLAGDFTAEFQKSPNAMMCSLQPSHSFLMSFNGQIGSWDNVNKDTAYNDIKSALNDILEAKKRAYLPDMIPIEFTSEEWEELSNPLFYLPRQTGKSTMIKLLRSLSKTKKNSKLRC